MNRSTNQGIQASIAKGWKPNAYLTNMSMAFFQNPADFVATSIFPICPVPLSASYFYTFSKADLARDNVQRKPAFGHVNPAIMGQEDNSYKCQVDQVLVGIDQIAQLNYQRSNAPGVADPRRAKVRFATEQMLLHQDILFASKFFKAAAWGNVKTGKSTTPGTNEFWKWDNSSSDPIGQIDDLKAEIKRNGRRTPNRLALGVDAYIALKNHPDIIDRIKYTGTTANPAGIGQAAAMDFICDSKAALLCYATPTPQIDEPSAGYIFTWDMLGNGQPVAFDQFEGTPADHSEFIEGLMSTDMKKTCDDLAVFLEDCV